MSSLNQFNALVDQARNRLKVAEEGLATLRADYEVYKAQGLTTAIRAKYGLGAGTSTFLNAIRGQEAAIAVLRSELADLERQRDEVDRKAAAAIANGVDPATAYATEARKAELKALGLQLAKYAAVVLVLLLLAWIAWKVYKRTAA